MALSKGKYRSMQHWVVVERAEGQNMIYDSTGEARTSMSADLKKQILQLNGVPFRSLNSLNVLYPRAHQQPNGSNTCGQHAVANLTELVFGGKPSTVRFAGPKMRPHLKNCIAVAGMIVAL